MNKLKQLFENLSIKDAENLLGLSQGWSKDDLALAYRRSAMKAHPDRGGTDSAMKDINNAKEVLDKLNRSSDAEINSRKDGADAYSRAKEFVTDDIKARVIPKEFNDYFEDIFQEKFIVTLTFPSRYASSFGVLKATSSDRTKHFELHLNPDIYQMVKDASQVKSLGDNLQDTPYSVIVSGYSFSGDRKTKIFAGKWTKTSKSAQFSNPSIIFPKSKITKEPTRKFSKRDMLVGLQLLNPIWSSDKATAWIPLTDGNYFQVHRLTFRGSAIWTFYGVYKKVGHSMKHDISMIHNMEETEATLEAFRHLTKLDSNKALQFVKAKIDAKT